MTNRRPRSPRDWLPIWTCRRWGHVPDKSGRCKRCRRVPLMSVAGVRAVQKALTKLVENVPPSGWDFPPTKPPPKSRRLGRRSP